MNCGKRHNVHLKPGRVEIGTERLFSETENLLVHQRFIKKLNTRLRFYCDLTLIFNCKKSIECGIILIGIVLIFKLNLEN